MDETELQLREKLRAVEARFAGAAADDEPDDVRQRIMTCLAERSAEEVIDAKFSLDDPWTRRVLIALAKRYGLRAYRLPRQRRLTVVITGPESFIRDILMPEYNEMAQMLYDYLEVITERLVSDVFRVDEGAEGRSEAHRIDPEEGEEDPSE